MKNLFTFDFLALPCLCVLLMVLQTFIPLLSTNVYGSLSHKSHISTIESSLTATNTNIMDSHAMQDSVDIAITSANLPDTLYTLTTALGSWTMSNLGDINSAPFGCSLLASLYPLNSANAYALVFLSNNNLSIPILDYMDSAEYSSELFVSDVTYPPTSSVSPIQVGDYLLCMEWFSSTVYDTNPANNRICQPVHIAYGDVYSVSNASAAINAANYISYHANIDMTTQQYYVPYSFQLSADSIPSLDDIVLSVGTYYTYDNPYDGNIDVNIALPNNIAYGDYYLIAQYGSQAVENTSMVIESNYSNNISILPITISATFSPDVVMLQSYLQTNNAQIVGWFIIQNNTNITNNVGLYLSTDNTFSPNDLLLDQYSNNTFYSQQIYFDALLPNTTPSGNYYIILVADNNNTINEINETNNTAIMPFYYNSATLGIDVAIVNASTTTIVSNNTDVVSINYSLQNVGIGDSYLNTFQVFVYDSNGEEVLNQSSSLYSTSISPDEVITYNYDLSGIDALPEGDYTILITVDNVGDSNMSNNSSTLSLTITSSTVDIVPELYYLASYSSAGSNLNIPYRIKNASGVAVGSSQARMYISTDNTLSADDLLVTDETINNLQAYQTYDNTESIQIPDDFLGSVLYVILLADANNDIAEVNENNNSYVAYTNIIGQNSGGAIDLMLDNIQTPSSLSALQEFSIGVRVWNLGNGDAPISTVKYYLSSDYFLQEAEDIYLGEKVIPATLANTKATHLHTLTLPANSSLGAYYLLAKTDATNEVVETNEYNNTNFKAVNIVEGSTPTDYTDISLLLTCDKNATVNNYDFVTYTLKVINNGTIPATQLQVMFKQPDNLAYVGDNTTTSNASIIANYNYWFGTLDINQLPPNDTVTVVLESYHVTDPNPIVCFAQVLDAVEIDIDSQPNNNTSNSPTQDDEALVVLNANGGNQANKEHGLSGITSLHLNHVYPSPATTQLSLNLYNSIERPLWFNIYDTQGKLVQVIEQMLHEGINLITFDIDNLSGGVYWIQSNLGERAIVFVKQ